MVGIAVDTATPTGMVRSDVNAPGTSARSALIFIAADGERNPTDTGQTCGIDTGTVSDPPSAVVPVFGAGVDADPAIPRDLCKAAGDLIPLRAVRRADTEGSNAAFDIPVKIEETDDTGIGISGEAVTHGTKRIGMIPHRISII